MAKGSLKKKEYEALVEPLHIELNNLAHWLRVSGKRLLVLFEGRDAAGKGGVINTITSTLNPRQVRVEALGTPTDREKSEWYFQRYVPHLPAAGEFVLFDRSWYNRAGVEKVMGFCTPAQYRRFLAGVPVFERQLADDGIILLKYWLAVDQKYQEERFAERAADPLKRWKLSPIDIKARTLYEDYGLARDAMFLATHRKFAPWFVVEFNDQRRGRLNLIRHLLDQIHDTKVPEEQVVLPPLKKKPVKERYTGPVKPIRATY
ncbi:MAG: polyphosphate kinase 2 [Gammaproteobacteria bacterium]